MPVGKHYDPSRKRLGFTFVELVIVLVVIGLLAVVAIPRINLTRYRIESAMRGVGTALIAAQRYAVTRQHDVIVLLDAGNQTIRVHDDANNNQAQDSGERVRAIPLGDNIVIGQGNAPAYTLGPGPITFTKQVGGVPAVTFHRNGAASELGGLYLTSTRALNSGGNPEDSRFIRIERATGRVEWYRYLPPSWTRGF